MAASLRRNTYVCVYGLRSTSSSNCILLGFIVFYLVSPSRSIDKRLRTFGVTIVEGHARNYSTRLFAIENSVTVACFVDSCQHTEPLLPGPVAVIDIAQLNICIYVYAKEGGHSFWRAPVVLARTENCHWFIEFLCKPYLLNTSVIIYITYTTICYCPNM